MIRISVCTGKACRERFSAYIIRRLENDRKKFFPDMEMDIGECLCRNQCREGPNVVFDDTIASRVSPIRASELLAERVHAARRVVWSWK